MPTFTTTSWPSLAMARVAQTLVTNEINAELHNYGYKVPVDQTKDPTAYALLSSAAETGIAARVMSMLPQESYTYPELRQEGGNRRQMLDREYNRFLESIRSRRLKAERESSRMERFDVGSAETEEGMEKYPLFTRGQFDYPGSRLLQEGYNQEYRDRYQG